MPLVDLCRCHRGFPLDRFRPGSRRDCRSANSFELRLRIPQQRYSPWIGGQQCKMAWIHLNDDAYMWKNIEEGAQLGGYNSGHAVWVSVDLAMKIRYFGDFKHEGDVVKIVGTYNAACPQHGGDMDIHASTLDIVRVGHPVHDAFNTARTMVALFLLVVAFALHRIRTIIRRRHAF
ncbi:MAG: hypothetical protein H6Q48_5067 [Deltaproteobacteria bacterium]|nr:hypothetical protein [Deltaproteobacteria bacterium]